MTCKLKSVGVRPSARHAIVFGNRIVKCGGNVKEPGGPELGRAGPLALTDAAGEVGQVVEKSVKFFA